MNAHTYNAPAISAGALPAPPASLLALTNQVLSALGKPVLCPSRKPDRGAAGHRQYHHRGRAGRVVEGTASPPATFQADQTTTTS